MKIKEGSLGLNIPVQAPERKTQLTLTTEAVTKWRSSLPMVDTGATAKLLYFALTELNLAALNPNTRFELIELFRSPVQTICLSLGRHFLNQTTKLSKQQLTVANLATTLETSMAYNYKTILEELHIGIEQNKIDAKDYRKLVATCIHRVLYYHSKILLRSYHLYSQPPINTWREIHLLFVLGQQLNVLKEDIQCAYTKIEKNISIENIYLQIVLFAAANPYQWRQNEQVALNNVMDKWISLVEYSVYDKDIDTAPGFFAINLKADEGPTPHSMKIVYPSKTALLLKLSKLYQHIEKNLLKEMLIDEIKTRIKNSDNIEFSLSTSILLRLKSNWSKVLKRAHKRYPISGNMHVCFGLSATHYYASGEKEFNPNMSAEMPSGKSTTTQHHTTTLKTLELGQDMLQVSDSNSLSLELEVDTNEQATQALFPCYECKLNDISPSGACLSWIDDTFPAIQAGEILAMRSSITSPQNAHWSIGLVRWLRYSPKGGLQIGVQLLASYANAAAAQLITDNQPAGYLLRCLMLPALETGEKELNFPPTIITPILPFKVGKKVGILTERSKFLEIINLNELVDSTGSYKQFTYTSESGSNNNDVVQSKEVHSVLENELANQHHAKSVPDDIDEGEFGSIWDDL